MAPDECTLTWDLPLGMLEGAEVSAMEKNNDWAADAARVAMSQKHEVAYWTKKWGITEEQLAEAHKVAGPMADKIEAHLKKTGVLKS